MHTNPRILIVTPEITYLPHGMGNMSYTLNAKAGGLADVSAALVSALFDLGADIHVALPHYRRMFNIDVGRLINDELRVYRTKLPNSRIHLAEDRIFYYRSSVYGNDHVENPKIALAFQREVINNIIPEVQPDLIHCNDWMTGLIPAMARRMNIPCLITVHNIHTYEILLETIEDNGIDAAVFWKYLYYKRMPSNYEETRSSNPVDLLASGLFASHFINTVSPTFLEEIVQGKHDFVPPQIRYEMKQKLEAGCACGILNAPDPSFNPATDNKLVMKYNADTHEEGKRVNKIAFQERMGLIKDRKAPLFFWPSRLDPIQKGCQLFTDILYKVISKYWKENLQVAVVANGPYQKHFREIQQMHDFRNKLAIADFDEGLSHLGYAAADFILMPSLFEPCGLPQMISAIYGTLTVAHDTGGLHDTVKHLNIEKNSGNGFVFETYDSNGLFWAIDRAMEFYKEIPEIKRAQISRIMKEAASQFNHDVVARRYVEMYEAMLKRPLLPSF